LSRRRKHPPHSNHERWLVSYADFITLLFAFFVVMYSTAQVDQRKVGKLAMAIQVAFQELGVFPASTTQIPVDAREPMPFNSVQAVENAQRAAALAKFVPPPRGVLSGSEENGDLTALRRELEQVLAPEILRQEVALRTEPDGLVVSLREIGFFDSGSADIRANSLNAFSRLAELLAQKQYRIRIEGHTDNVPIHNQKFADNWELSTARATEMIRLLITKYNFPAERLSAAGYAEFHPVSDNRTDAGRALNRRLDVVILGKQFPAVSAPTSNRPSPALPIASPQSAR
jgi:chemotaxis protein MotB